MAMQERKHYLDNLRLLTVLLLFPYHTFMIYNNWGESFYVHGENLLIPSILIGISWCWMMPLLFAIAGMGSRYALEKRSAGEYTKERVSKLLIPLVLGVLLLVPIQSYIAGLFWNQNANYLDFFTKLTDFTGYDSAFTPGQLWFILFLFVISMVCLPFMIWYKNKGKGTLGDKIPLIVVILMGILPAIGNMLFDISGKSPTEYLAYFLLGYFFLANEHVLEKLDRYRFLLLGLFVAGFVLTTYFNQILFEAVSWLSILAILGLARHYLNINNKLTTYLSKSSFGVYLFHQSWIVVVAYFVLKLTGIPALQIPIILLASVLLTFLTYEIAKRIPVLKWMFGLKK